jgi:hypothetical protein
MQNKTYRNQSYEQDLTFQHLFYFLDDHLHLYYNEFVLH